MSIDTKTDSSYWKISSSATSALTRYVEDSRSDIVSLILPMLTPPEIASFALANKNCYYLSKVPSVWERLVERSLPKCYVELKTHKKEVDWKETYKEQVVPRLKALRDFDRKKPGFSPSSSPPRLLKRKDLALESPLVFFSRRGILWNPHQIIKIDPILLSKKYGIDFSICEYTTCMRKIEAEIKDLDLCVEKSDFIKEKESKEIVYRLSLESAFKFVLNEINHILSDETSSIEENNLPRFIKLCSSYTSQGIKRVICSIIEYAFYYSPKEIEGSVEAKFDNTTWLALILDILLKEGYIFRYGEQAGGYWLIA